MLLQQCNNSETIVKQECNNGVTTGDGIDCRGHQCAADSQHTAQRSIQSLALHSGIEYTHTDIHTQTRIYTQIRTQANAHTYTNTHTNTHTGAHIYIHIHTCTLHKVYRIAWPQHAWLPLPHRRSTSRRQHFWAGRKPQFGPSLIWWIWPVSCDFYFGILVSFCLVSCFLNVPSICFLCASCPWLFRFGALPSLGWRAGSGVLQHQPITGAACLLSAVCCLLPAACCLLPAVYCLLSLLATTCYNVRE
jgi:hypothetical protein